MSPAESASRQRRGDDQAVYRLREALYGHPDAGTYWGQKCDQHAKSQGFKPVGEEWPSCYYNSDLKLFLVIYVDDFKLA
eukprot:14004011-Alexandrium_andersonii.AAC.1